MVVHHENGHLVVHVSTLAAWARAVRAGAGHMADRRRG
jgi:hypothetical protein